MHVIGSSAMFRRVSICWEEFEQPACIAIVSSAPADVSRKRYLLSPWPILQAGTRRGSPLGVGAGMPPKTPKRGSRISQRKAAGTLYALQEQERKKEFTRKIAL